jgi:NTP pyrophosphatase (non-canonical NTP hydrolase)
MRDLCLEKMDYLMILCSSENSRQLKKWDVQDRSPFEWLAYLSEEVGELSEAISEHHYDRGGQLCDVYTEAIQVATLALKIAEMYIDAEEQQ